MYATEGGQAEVTARYLCERAGHTVLSKNC